MRAWQSLLLLLIAPGAAFANETGAAKPVSDLVNAFKSNDKARFLAILGSESIPFDDYTKLSAHHGSVTAQEIWTDVRQCKVSSYSVVESKNAPDDLDSNITWTCPLISDPHDKCFMVGYALMVVGVKNGKTVSKFEPFEINDYSKCPVLRPKINLTPPPGES